MRIPRFYENQPLSLQVRLPLSETTHAHAIKALRMREGDALILFNGDGCEYQGKIEQVDKKTLWVRLLSKHPVKTESALRLEIGQAISRGERMDFAIQKATELGCASLTPLFTERCEVKLNQERQEKRQRHWQHIAQSACEQSLRVSIPAIQEPCDLRVWLQNCQADFKIVLHHHSAAGLLQRAQPTSVAILVGPEGGLTEAEVALAQAHGFQAWALGPRVMRTETAPLAACAVLQYLWGDFNLGDT